MSLSQGLVSHHSRPPTPDPMSCIFCDLIQGAAEVSVCYEDAEAIAFMDIQPVNAGHVLVVPRRHFERFGFLPPVLAEDVLLHRMRLTYQAMAEGLTPQQPDQRRNKR